MVIGRFNFAVDRCLDMRGEPMTNAWSAIGIYLQVILNIAFMFFLLGLCVGMFIAVLRTGDPSIAMKTLVPFGLALIAPLVLVMACAVVAKQFLS